MINRHSALAVAVGTLTAPGPSLSLQPVTRRLVVGEHLEQLRERDPTAVCPPWSRLSTLARRHDTDLST